MEVWKVCRLKVEFFWIVGILLDGIFFWKRLSWCLGLECGVFYLIYMGFLLFKE